MNPGSRLFHCHLMRPLPLLDRRHRLAGLSSKGADLFLHGEPIGGELPMLKGIPVASRSSASGAMHSADARSPNRRRLAL